MNNHDQQAVNIVRNISMKHFKIRCPRGAVLLEVLLSVMILAFGLTGITRSFFAGIQARRQAKGYLTAAVLLDNTLTELLAARYVDEKTARAGDGEGVFSGYRYEISAEAVQGSEILKKVHVKIFWPGPQQEYVIDAETYLFSNPGSEGGLL